MYVITISIQPQLTSKVIQEIKRASVGPTTAWCLLSPFLSAFLPRICLPFSPSTFLFPQSLVAGRVCPVQLLLVTLAGQAKHPQHRNERSRCSLGLKSKSIRHSAEYILNPSPKFLNTTKSQTYCKRQSPPLFCNSISLQSAISN